ncbi:hypothetical protein FOZG_18251 [Fusarium oxysporum Fo47]|uniref:Uncharacterized protein n=1 Tax=Fusarium oxysporum Fo47 TaxID=660027 RepID=W9JC53_FUSOX|nr:hypothetical protein FOZG_18251 [Fusarium oxysporum Fo47]
MDSATTNYPQRKPGVDYVRCQAEFEMQMLLLKEDMKKRYREILNEGKDHEIYDSSWLLYLTNLLSSPREEQEAKS